MSEKATLLTSIPPVAKSEPVKKASLLTSVDQPTPSVGMLTSTSESEAVAVVVADSDTTITMFQGAIYASFVLTFCLAGFAAVALFRKASKIAEARFLMAAKSLGVASLLIALHGFFTTYLFANYLNGEGAVPLLLAMAIWIFAGPAIAVILNYLLTPGSAPKKGAVVFDVCAYIAIFSCATIALAPGIKEDAALIFSLLAGFLFIVPVARSFSTFRKAKARHPELCETSDQVLIYSLLFLPALMPIVVFANVCNMSDEVTLLLLNFITFDFVLIAGLSMIASADDIAPKAAEVAVETEQPSVAVPLAEQSQSPVVEFSAQPKAKTRTKSKGKGKKLPPRKLSKVATNPALPPAPRKPGATAAAAAAAAAVEAPEVKNAPSRLKAPAKPKKRF